MMLDELQFVRVQSHLPAVDAAHAVGDVRLGAREVGLQRLAADVHIGSGCAFAGEGEGPQYNQMPGMPRLAAGRSSSRICITPM